MKNSLFNICCAKFLGSKVEQKLLTSGKIFYYYKTPKNNYLNRICGVSEEEAWKNSQNVNTQIFTKIGGLL